MDAELVDETHENHGSHGGGESDVPVIDLVLTSRDRGEYVLVLIEERPWDDPEAVADVTDRVNRCVSYVLDGHLTAEFPDTVGRDIRVDVRYEHEPTDAVAALFARFARALAAKGLDFSVEILGPPPLGSLPVSGRSRR
jgi:hypothetical protein